MRKFERIRFERELAKFDKWCYGGGGQSAPAPAQTTTTTQKNFTPAQEGGIEQIIAKGQEIYNTQGTPDANSLVPQIAQPSAQTTLAQNYATNYAMNTAPGVVNDMAGATKFGLSDIINNKDPTLDNAMGAMNDQITKKYMDPDGVIGQTRSYFQGAGGTGGTRDQLFSGIVGGRYLNDVANADAALAAQSRGDTLKTFSNALAFSPSMLQAGTQPANILSGVGTQLENQQQNVNNRDAAVAQATQNAPWANLSNFANLIYGSPVSGTTQTSNPTYQSLSSGGDNTLGTVMQLAGIAAMFMSDRRLKTEIRKIGRLKKSGLSLYEYKMFGHYTIGVMADEVAKAIPRAVEVVDGFMRVDYAQLA